MDRLIAAAVGLSDCNASVLTTLGAISAEVNRYVKSLIPSGDALNLEVKELGKARVTKRGC
jgi:hypothetical protein